MIEGRTQSQSARVKGTTTRRALLFAAGAAGLMASSFSKRANALSTRKTDVQEGNMRTGGTITTKDGTQIFYKDWGPKDAQPIVFHHGWPLSSDDWDVQMLFFLANGYRVVAHDRRGHGRSSQVATGHDMDHYASDASAVAEHLDLRNAIHIGIRRVVAKWRAM